MARWLYLGTVAHKRLGHATHGFRYPALFVCFPLSAVRQLRGPLFGVDRFNLFSFHQKDHGDGRDAEAWMRGILREHGLDGIASGEIWLHTLPRMLGFVFNPVSFWYCHDREDRLRAVFCEVNNTFGERHGYLLTASDRGGNPRGRDAGVPQDFPCLALLSRGRRIPFPLPPRGGSLLRRH